MTSNRQVNRLLFDEEHLAALVDPEGYVKRKLGAKEFSVLLDYINKNVVREVLGEAITAIRRSDMKGDKFPAIMVLKLMKEGH